MRFIDLFAGLGGFHLALGRLGHECVFASEIDPGLQALYECNFGIRPAGDIRHVPVADIPGHDIACAGFPCQPFSKAGDQSGLEHPENVPNLERHNKGLTWQQLAAQLRGEGYDVSTEKLSPHQFGILQIRDRIFVGLTSTPRISR